MEFDHAAAEDVSNAASAVNAPNTANLRENAGVGQIMDNSEDAKLALDIFTEDYISFFPQQHEIIAELDKTQIIRVVTNLVKNATHALEETDNRKIEVTVSEDNGNVEIIVADNGKGISDEDKDKIFEPKFTTKSSGMGLGLGIVKNIIESHGGIISFVSTPKKGTTFTIVLPTSV